MQTQFMSPFVKQDLLEKIKKGVNNADAAFHRELDRLENRIRQLELGLEVAESKLKDSIHLKPDLSF